MYHHLRLLIDPAGNRIDRFEWQALLKVTPAKLRSLQRIESARFLSQSLDNPDNWRIIVGSLQERSLVIDDGSTNRVQLYVESEHAKQMIEKFLATLGAAPDYRLNANILAVDAGLFIQLVDAAIEATGVDRASLAADVVDTLQANQQLAAAVDNPIEWLSNTIQHVRDGNNDGLRADAGVVLRAVWQVCRNRIVG